MKILQIPRGMSETNAKKTSSGDGESNANRYCGRILASTSGSATTASICSRSYPFRIGVHFDDGEIGHVASPTAVNNEQDTSPGGIVGFKFEWYQGAC